MKTTIATVKSFIRKNQANAFINEKSRFDGMTDGVESRHDGFLPLTKTDTAKNGFAPHDREYPNLGFKSVWFVGSSRDYCKPYEDANFVGFEVQNSCGYWIVAIRKPQQQAA